jgi:anti-sigma regulatory factor (Ser/Thr protein kinase)
MRLWLVEQHTPEDEVLDILLAVSEAFGNAIVHARQPRSIAVHVDASMNDGVVEIVVRDHGRWQEDTLGAGLGLQLMHALMDTVEFQTTPAGTTVRLRRALGPRVIRIDTVASVRERIDVLGRSSIFAPQPATMLERLAAQLIPFSATADETIIREGDQGELFYLIAKGELDVQAERSHVATLGPGDHVGEIALLRGVPRTATIVAQQPVELYALTRDDFLEAVRSSHASTRAIESMMATRLTGLRDVLGHAPLALG